MGKYTDDATRMLELIGGKENISAVTHCVTRMRFVLHDPKKADIKGIEALKSVKGSFTQAGQFQVSVIYWERCLFLIILLKPSFPNLSFGVVLIIFFGSLVKPFSTSFL